MIETVEKFLDNYNLKGSDNTFLVGFSGGCDSLCLLDILNELSKKYKFKIIALHLNHNWRGEESFNEELNCKKFCNKLGIDFISETLDGSIQKTENSAREARYNFFLKHAKKYPKSSIFTAHTRTDNAETLIYRIIKGTGISGLKGIPATRKLEDICIYRPILSISRKRIDDYCHSKGLVPNNDSSNLDLSYKRNFIRHKIMPLFDEINFHAEKSIASLAKLAISQSNIVEEYLSQIKKDIYENEKLLTEKFIKLSADVKRKIIYDICISENLDYDCKKIEKIIEFINSNFNSKSGSRLSITNDLWLFVNSKYIYLITKTKGDENKNEIIISEEGRYEIPDTNLVFSIEKYIETGKVKYPKETDNFAYVNLNDIGLNFVLRTRRDGDFIVPFGMTGSMKLKKYLNSKGISQHKKDELVLLTKDSEVFWVASVGLSNKLKVEKQPTHVIRLEDK